MLFSMRNHRIKGNLGWSSPKIQMIIHSDVLGIVGVFTDHFGIFEIIIPDMWKSCFDSPTTSWRHGGLTDRFLQAFVFCKSQEWLMGPRRVTMELCETDFLRNCWTIWKILLELIFEKKNLPSLHETWTPEFSMFLNKSPKLQQAQPKEQLFLYLWYPNFLQQNLYLIPSGFVNTQTFALQHLPPWTVVAPPQNRGPKRTGRTTPQISRFEGSLSVVKISGGPRSARPKVSHGTKDSHTIHVKLYISILYLHLGSLYTWICFN